MNTYKTIGILAVIILAVLPHAYGQGMIPGQKGLEINAGVLSSGHPKENYCFDLSLTVNSSSFNYWILGLAYLHSSVPYRSRHTIPVETYLGTAGYSKRLVSNNNKSISLHVTISAIGGYEMINRGTAVLYDGAVIENKEGLVYGGACRLSLETCLCEQLTLLIQGNLRSLWGTTTGQFRPSAGAGLRFNF